ncbi:MAG: lipid-A-disaccharide synthase [Pedobacter sp.]|nr:MAG: lipid-A-disaccharide synthase [Pedobacter sp.]
MKYYLIAGEASGDLHGANLMRALKKEDAEADFRFFGGDLMKAQGGKLEKHYSEMAFMGFLEVLIHVRAIFRNLKQAKKAILDYHPDALILIDFPGFNLKIASFAKKHGIRVFYYISPKVWAWNQKRVLSIKKNVDQLFCIFPFEVDFYKTWGMDVHYVGNPLLDAIAAHHTDSQFRVNQALGEQQIIALLPGSRRQELKRLLTDMLQVSDDFPDYQFVIAGAPSFIIDDYQPFIGGRQIPVLFDQTYNLLLHAKAAIVTSGTATLETALFKVPQVVVYKGGRISVAIARLLVKIKFISLVNLIMGQEIVKELIQENCTPKSIKMELERLLQDSFYRGQMLGHYDQLVERMGEPGASNRVAKLVVHYLGNSLKRSE